MLSMLRYTPSQQAKALVALVGAVATALLGVFASDTTVGQVLTFAAAGATWLSVYWAKNSPVVEPLPSGGPPVETDVKGH